MEPDPRVLRLRPPQESVQLVALVLAADRGDFGVLVPAVPPSVGPGLQLPHKTVFSGVGSACSVKPWRGEGKIGGLPTITFFLISGISVTLNLKTSTTFQARQLGFDEY